MKAIASSSLEFASKAIFRGPDNDLNEAAVEITLATISTPLTIPKAEEEAAVATAFSAMSIDTVASSMAETEGDFEAVSSSLVSNTDEANDEDDNIRIINMAEVKEHCDPSDAWMVIYDRVYDVTEFLIEVRVGKVNMESNLLFGIFFSASRRSRCHVRLFGL